MPHTEHLQIWDPSVTLIGQLAMVTLSGAGVRWSITFRLLSSAVPIYWPTFNAFWRHDSPLSGILSRLFTTKCLKLSPSFSNTKTMPFSL